MWFKERSKEPEVMDLGLSSFTKEEYDECLRMLGRIGHLLKGNQISMKALQGLVPFKSVLDVGCGGGDFAHLVAKQFPSAEVTGFDIEQLAIEHARDHFKRANLSYVQGTEIGNQQYDIVTATLVCHHLEENDLVGLIQKMHQTANQAILINDLHRSPLAYAGYALLSFLLFPNRLIRKDGLLSIRKGFKKRDWHRLLEKAGIPSHQISIQWKWPFRWCVVVHKDGKNRDPRRGSGGTCSRMPSC